MFSLTSSHRYHLHHQPTDMRKGFDSLSGLVRSVIKSNPMDGSVYVFLNKSRTLIKLLHWEEDGFTLYYKRLERGVFERPAHRDSPQLSWNELMLIVAGISLDSIQKKERYKLPEK